VGRKARKLGIHSGKLLVEPVNSAVDSLWTTRPSCERRHTGLTLEAQDVTGAMHHAPIFEGRCDNDASGRREAQPAAVTSMCTVAVTSS
jgi:hypothetical protein